MFSWFDTKDVDALVDRLVADLVAAASGPRDHKLRKVHDRVLAQARAFSGERHLNLYQKGRLANRFKWALLEAKYPKELVDELTYELAAAVGQGQAKRN
jgi:hypothetical protein